MFDQSKILAAAADGVCFVCRLCKKWHEGQDAGLRDVMGNKKCAAKNGCDGPIGGNDFPEYSGPLAGQLSKFCYVCGDPAEIVLEPKKSSAVRIGCCRTCFLDVTKLASNPENRFIMVTTEERAGKAKFEEMR